MALELTEDLELSITHDVREGWVLAIRHRREVYTEAYRNRACSLLTGLGRLHMMRIPLRILAKARRGIGVADDKGSRRVDRVQL
jgi:hypothetical protein